MKKQKGLGLIGVLLIIGVLLLTAGGVVWEKKVTSTSTPTPIPTSILPPPTAPASSPTITTPSVVSPTPQDLGSCKSLSQGECETNWECDPIYRTGSCQPTGPIALPVEVYCGCKSLSTQEKRSRLQDKVLCEQTNGQWGIRNCLCLPQKDGVPLYTPEEGTHYFVSQRGCVSDKTACQETSGRWTPGQPCNCPIGKNFRSGIGCLQLE
jgi:hypothetical protein